MLRPRNNWFDHPTPSFAARTLQQVGELLSNLTQLAHQKVYSPHITVVGTYLGQEHELLYLIANGENAYPDSTKPVLQGYKHHFLMYTLVY